MVNLLIINMGKNYGGTEKNIEDIIKGIYRRNFNIIILGRKGTKFIEEVSKFENIIVIDVQISKSNIIKTINIVKSIVKKYNIDIIHAHGITSLLLGIFSKKRCKVITTIHGYSNYDRMDRGMIERSVFSILERYLLRRVDYCIAVSYDIKKYILEKGISEKIISVINHGISVNNIDSINEKKIAHNSSMVKIGSVGRLETVKAYDILIQAIEMCKNKAECQIVCEIAGEGKEKDNLNTMIVEKGMEGNCKLIGFIDDVNSFYKSLDIYVQPSYIESFGISIVEAMSMGVPVIATDSGGVRDFIIDNVTGIRCEVGNVEELAKSIMFLIDDSKKRKDIGYKGKQHVLENFRKEDKIKEIENTYIKVLRL